jgi:hypothetical protein
MLERARGNSPFTMRAVRFLTAPRTRTAAISENASVPTARNISSPMKMVLLSLKMSWNTATIESMVRS